MNFFYDEGPSGKFRPVLQDFSIDNVNVLDGAPYSLFIRGYPDHPTTSYIGVTLRNITFSGLTNDPHFVLQDVDYISATDIVVDGVLWHVEPSSANSIQWKILLVFLATLFQIGLYAKC